MNTNKKLYLECYSGISGDMTVAALLDIGADENVLMKALASLPISGFKIEIKRVKKSGIDACDFNVILDKEHENHDHDMEYLHGEHHHHEHSHEHEHHHEEEHAHTHEHEHEHHHHHTHEHTHEHRNLAEILHIISHADITPRARQTAVDIFTALGKAEAKAHGIDIDHVHFHEVGAVDSIVDIVAAAVCIDNLNIDEVIIPKLYEGHGFVRCQHGMMPVPVPAVTRIAEEYNLNLQITNVEGELVTPTGAAIAAVLKTSDVLPKSFSIEKIGIGAGKRSYERPSMLRAMIIKENSEEKDSIYKLESNIDDCSGELLGYVMEKLFSAGARDVHYTPVFMKKNRPAYQINVICTEDKVADMEKIIFEETTTIGIRHIKMERTVLRRRTEKIKTSLGEAEVKICEAHDFTKVYPEYESAKKIALEKNLPLQKVYEIIQNEYKHEEGN